MTFDQIIEALHKKGKVEDTSCRRLYGTLPRKICTNTLIKILKELQKEDLVNSLLTDLAKAD